MSATGIAEVLSGECMEVRFPGHYSQKDFVRDWIRLRDLAHKRDRERLTDAELAEVPDLRKRIARVNADSVLLLILESRKHGGFNFL
jgi:hypothetical protein